MAIIQTLILGIIEGITEFIPVSSTFHLIFSAKVLRLPDNSFLKLFEVFIQSGAILAVVVLYWRRYIKDKEFIKKILLAFVPTAILGAVLYKLIKNTFFESPILMVSVFIFVGILFLLFEFLAKKKITRPEKDIGQLSYWQAFLVGTLQAFSFLPGFSRAGAIILSMILLGFRRAEAAYFSFALAIPTMFAASFFDLIKTASAQTITSYQYLLLAIGFIVSYIFAHLTIKWFISYLENHTLKIFGWYRIILGVVILILLFA